MRSEESRDDELFFELIACLLILAACTLAPLVLVAAGLKSGHAVGHTGLGLFRKRFLNGSKTALGSPPTETLHATSNPTLMSPFDGEGHQTAADSPHRDGGPLSEPERDRRAA